jgi:ABC-2 type transport system permease protein
LSLKRLLAIAGKELIHVIRDYRSLTAAIGIPMIMMLLYCYSLSLDVEHIPTVVLNLDGTQLSRDLTDRFGRSGYFDILREAVDYREVEREIDSGNCMIGLVIPRDFSKLFKSGREVPLQVLLDGTDPNRTSISLGYVNSIVQTLTLESMRDHFNRLGLAGLVQPLEPRIRVWFNPELKSRNFIIPGLIAIIMAILAALLTSLTLSREWESGTMELLISTPARSSEIVLGKLIPYFVLGFMDTVFIALAGRWIFGVVLKGNLLVMALVISVFLVGVLMMGMLISSAVRSQLLANQIAFLGTFLPTLILSGFVFFIPAMPEVIRWFTFLVPARYFITSLRGIYMKGVGLDVIWPQLVFLVIFDLLVIVLTLKRFVKKLE